MPPLASLPNLGPRSQDMLARAGITSLDQLRALGSVAAYVRTKRANTGLPGGASLNLLWALEGVLSGCSWKEVARAHRTSLILALDEYERRNPA